MHANGIMMRLTNEMNLKLNLNQSNRDPFTFHYIPFCLISNILDLLASTGTVQYSAAVQCSSPILRKINIYYRYPIRYTF